MCMYMDVLKAKCKDLENRHQRDLVISCLRLFLYEACHYIENSNTAASSGYRGNELKNQFLALVIRSSREHRQVAYYADKLCVTPRHLTMTLQRILGRSAKEWIDDYVTLEEKIMLRSSGLSIQEIADQINFPDQSYLGRFFKHQTGMSPSQSSFLHHHILSDGKLYDCHGIDGCERNIHRLVMRIVTHQLDAIFSFRTVHILHSQILISVDRK